MTTPIAGTYGIYQVNMGSPVNSGGIGSIYRTSDPSVVYKEYHALDKAPDRAALERLVHIGREVVVHRREKLGATPESSINWPIDIVVGPDARTKGVVLPAIPLSLFNEYGKPRTLEFLIMARAAPPVAQVRVFLLLRMAEILAYVDSRQLVHGDINGKNLAWTGGPDPIMYLIDCDGIVDQYPAPSVGVQAMGWTDPRIVERTAKAHDHFSDWYALALAMYRGLLLVPGNLTAKKNDGTWPMPSQIPSELDARLAGLLHRALDNPLDAAARPRPAEWVRTLVDVYVPNGVYDTNALAVLDRVSQPRPTFTPVPLPTPPRPIVPAQTSPITTHPQPAQPAPTRPQPLTIPPAAYPAPTYPPPSYPPPTYPVPAFAPQPLAPPVGPPLSGTRIRRPASTALSGRPGWYILLLVGTCFWPIGVVLTVIAGIQLLRLPSWYAGRTRALVVCAVFAALSIGFAIFSFVNAAST